MKKTPSPREKYARESEAGSALYEAAVDLLKQWEKGNLSAAVQKLARAVAKAEGKPNLTEARPDLLEALRKIANISRYPISDPENIAFALETAREIARTAIAKVEGKQ